MHRSLVGGGPGPGDAHAPLARGASDLARAMQAAPFGAGRPAESAHSGLQHLGAYDLHAALSGSSVAALGRRGSVDDVLQGMQAGRPLTQPYPPVARWPEPVDLAKAAADASAASQADLLGWLSDLQDAGLDATDSLPVAAHGAYVNMQASPSRPPVGPVGQGPSFMSHLAAAPLQSAAPVPVSAPAAAPSPVPGRPGRKRKSASVSTMPADDADAASAPARGKDSARARAYSNLSQLSDLSQQSSPNISRGPSLQSLQASALAMASAGSPASAAPAAQASSAVQFAMNAQQLPGPAGRSPTSQPLASMSMPSTAPFSRQGSGSSMAMPAPGQQQPHISSASMPFTAQLPTSAAPPAAQMAWALQGQQAAALLQQRQLLWDMQRSLGLPVQGTSEPLGRGDDQLLGLREPLRASGQTQGMYVHPKLPSHAPRAMQQASPSSTGMPFPGQAGHEAMQLATPRGDAMLSYQVDARVSARSAAMNPMLLSGRPSNGADGNLFGAIPGVPQGNFGVSTPLVSPPPPQQPKPARPSGDRPPEQASTASPAPDQPAPKAKRGRKRTESVEDADFTLKSKGRGSDGDGKARARKASEPKSKAKAKPERRQSEPAFRVTKEPKEPAQPVNPPPAAMPATLESLSLPTTSPPSSLFVVPMSAGQGADWPLIAASCRDPAAAVSLIPSFVRAVSMDVSAFTQEAISAANPDQIINTCVQMFSPSFPDRNFSPEGEETWACRSVPSTMTLRDFMSTMPSIRAAKLPGRVPDADAGPGVAVRATDLTEITFGTSIEMVGDGWAAQTAAIQRLPEFVRPMSSECMLHALGTTLPGLSTAQLSLKVEGVRTPGRQETGSLSHVNINVAGSPCTWFAVAEEHRSAIEALLRARGMQFAASTWWPSVSELRRANIPVTVFSQQPGDLVYVNAGTIHWVQATGASVCVTWSVFPYTRHQLAAAWAAGLRNAAARVVSACPMQCLLLGVVQSAPLIAEHGCRTAIVLAFERLLLQEREIAQALRLRDIRPRSRKPDRNGGLFCTICAREIFNTVFFDGGAAPRCFYCSQDELSALTAVQFHRIQALEGMLNAFCVRNYAHRHRIPTTSHSPEPEAPSASPPPAEGDEATPLSVFGAGGSPRVELMLLEQPVQLLSPTA
eukprot:m.74273 g.74273  ORF g.74273 m.74273 type:complete len:1140 (+) comp7762_c0_seq1:40-3459(+)